MEERSYTVRLYTLRLVSRITDGPVSLGPEELRTLAELLEEREALRAACAAVLTA